MLFIGWLGAVDATILLATTLTLPVAMTLCGAMLGLGVAGIRQCCLLSSSGAVRAIEWHADGPLAAWIGPACMPGGMPVEVRLGQGSFRLGEVAFLLRLEARDRIHIVLIDVGKQDPRAIRRLARRLNWAPERWAGESSRAS